MDLSTLDSRLQLVAQAVCVNTHIRRAGGPAGSAQAPQGSLPAPLQAWLLPGAPLTPVQARLLAWAAAEGSNLQLRRALAQPHPQAAAAAADSSSPSSASAASAVSDAFSVYRTSTAEGAEGGQAEGSL